MKSMFGVVVNPTTRNRSKILANPKYNLFRMT